jgi:hypothetical protein
MLLGQPAGRERCNGREVQGDIPFCVGQEVLTMDDSNVVDTTKFQSRSPAQNVRYAIWRAFFRRQTHGATWPSRQLCSPHSTLSQRARFGTCIRSPQTRLPSSLSQQTAYPQSPSIVAHCRFLPTMSSSTTYAQFTTTLTSVGGPGKGRDINPAIEILVLSVGRYMSQSLYHR